MSERSIQAALRLPGGRKFTWPDGERIVYFGEGRLAEAQELLEGQGWDRFELLTTSRALNEAPLELPQRAEKLHYVPLGPVNEVAAGLIGDVLTPSLVALGGGRVIDTAKAIAAVRGGRVAALPTTLSGAEMTAIHRLPEGFQAPHPVRPTVVIAEPGPMTGLPEKQLRASAMNALAHGAEALYTPLANPVASMAALRGAELIARALDQRRADRDAAALALGSVLCAQALDSALFALHHVVSQTVVRAFRLPHAETNAAILPRSMEAMGERAPEAIGALAAALGTTKAEIGKRIEKLAGGRGHLSKLGADAINMDMALNAILARPELQMTPDPPDREELRALIEAAW
jgi:alcohol dehydrogenase class IV